MSHKKLQKLCYYAVAWGYALLDKAISKDSYFEARTYGAVSPVLFQKYKRAAPWIELDPDKNFIGNFDAATEDLLESVFATYGNETANSLENLTRSDSPWINARAKLAPGEFSNVQISIEDMKDYYRSIYTGDDY
jgi:uncharacterized phage-associated protein